MLRRVLDNHEKNKRIVSALEAVREKGFKMKKQVSALYMMFGLFFALCLVVANIVEQKLISIGLLRRRRAFNFFRFLYCK
jgi:DNA primase large subunit